MKKQTFIFSLVLLTVGLFFIFTIPLLWGYDETAHFARAYQVSEGGWTATTDYEGHIGGELPKNYVDFTKRTIDDRKSIEREPNIIPTKYVSDPNLYTEEARQEFSTDKKFFGFSGAAAYSPVAYSPPAIGMFLTKPFNPGMRDTILISRLASFFVFVFLAVSAFFLLRKDGARFIVVAVSLLPSMVVQSATLGTDSLALGLALLIFALTKRAADNEFQLPKKLYLILLATAMALSLVKVNYIFLSLLVLLVRPDRAFYRIPKNQWLKKTLVTVIVVLPALLWNLAVSAVASNITNKTGVDPVKQAVNVATGPIEFVAAILRSTIASDYVYVTGILGRAGWGGIVFPLSVLILAAILLVYAAMLASPAERIGKALTKNRTILSYVYIAVSLATSIGVFLTLYLTFTPIGSSMVDGVHGRYFIPVLPFLLLGLSHFSPIRASVQSQHRVFITFILLTTTMLAYAGVWYKLAIY